jgi:hypothetical protein
MPQRISDIHKEHHAASLRLARQCRAQGDAAAWGRMFALAQRARFYYATLHSLGE